MFTFGDPVDSAKLYLDDVVENRFGPPMVEGHYEELELEDLRTNYTWLVVAFKRALYEDLDESVLEVFKKWYDELFAHVVEVDEKFRQKVLTSAWQPPHGLQFSEEYTEIARRYSES